MDQLSAITGNLHIPYAGESVMANWQEKVNGVDYFLEENPTGFHRFRLVFEEKDQGYLEWQKENGVHRIPFALNGLKEGIFPEFNQPCYGSGSWCEENGFYLLVWLTGEEVSSVHFKMIFLEDGSLTVLMKKTEDVYLNEYQGLLNGHK